MNSASLPLAVYEVERDGPSPSCFLEGTKIQYCWDSTSLGYLKTCPRLYQYIMLEGWSSRDESVHLRFGQEYHSTLEDYDRLKAKGESHESAMRSAIGDLIRRVSGWSVDQETKAGRYKNADTLFSLCIDYLDKFKEDKAITFLLEDGRPAVELSFRFELDWGPQAAQEDEAICRAREQGNFDTVEGVGQPYLLCGHLDKVVNFCENLFVMDRKTTTQTLGSYFFDKFEPDNQMTLYTLASQVIIGSPVKGVIVDGAQILLDKPNAFERGITYRSPDQLEEWTTDLRYWLALAETYANANYWPQNDTACDKFGGCRFREICSKSPGVRERFLESKFIKLPESERWNPMKPR